MSQIDKAVYLFFAVDKRHTRTLNILIDLLEGHSPTSIARKYKMSKRAVYNIKDKYLNNDAAMGNHLYDLIIKDWSDYEDY